MCFNLICYQVVILHFKQTWRITYSRQMMSSSAHFVIITQKTFNMLKTILKQGIWIKFIQLTLVKSATKVAPQETLFMCINLECIMRTRNKTDFEYPPECKYFTFSIIQVVQKKISFRTTA